MNSDQQDAWGRLFVLAVVGFGFIVLSAGWLLARSATAAFDRDWLLAAFRTCLWLVTMRTAFHAYPMFVQVTRGWWESKK